MPPDIEIIVGTYEEYLLGYQLIESTAEGSSSKLQLKQTFADRSHAGSIKSVAVQGPWVASGGTDDRIFVYDMRTRKQSQIILSHAGTINTLQFSPDLTHLLSGGADGHMIATRVGSWSTEGDWKKAHAGRPVTHISCHPSSKLALSLGGDQVLNTWNLVKGRMAYKTNLKGKTTLGSQPDCLSWSTQGEYFTLSGPLFLEIWDIKSAHVMRRTKMPAKPICVTWLSGSECLVGLENGSVAWISANDEEDTPPTFISAHEARVKSIAFLKETLATVSSAGEIKVWTPNIEKRTLKEIASTNMDCRPTGLGLLDLSQFGNARPVEQLIKVEKKPKAKGESGQSAIPPAPRGFVTIEYEQDEKQEVEEESVATPKPKQKKNKEKGKAKKAAPKPEESSEESNSEEEDSEDIFDSDSDESSDGGHRRKRPQKRKQPPASASKQKFKQQKKK
ncbi:p21-activated protein kinase-interacting protein 1-like [Drosophila ficusphila]|uniref:p21-activated protein kinase-interacting protein 1-like n=1 Tax=Drosophila ficusphila TaxID=30025 RepID=UPI0007E65298|nr:p21-activated protein kinase-interacting protein 1-like [Drosophila ficusphila]